MYQYLHEDLDKNYSIIHALDGYDEISLTGKTKIISNKEEYIATPNHFGLPTYQAQDIFGGDTIESAAAIFVNVLNNESTQAQKDVVIANSAVAIQCFDQSKAIEACVAEARESIESGRAKESLNKIIA